MMVINKTCGRTRVREYRYNLAADAPKFSALGYGKPIVCLKESGLAGICTIGAEYMRSQFF